MKRLLEWLQEQLIRGQRSRMRELPPVFVRGGWYAREEPAPENEQPIRIRAAMLIDRLLGRCA